MREPFAFVTTYRQLMDALIRRRRQLGLSQMEADDIAGLQDGYTGKLEVWDRDNGRRLGPVSLDLLLSAYNLGIQLVALRPGKPRRMLRHPDQMALDLPGGGTNRHSDTDFVRLPGRRRRAHARVLESAEVAGDGGGAQAGPGEDDRGGDPAAVEADVAPCAGLCEGPEESA
ncbi:hypothetical protein [Xanthobacter flavus]|uniref:hypothetical protein n=1 Tax=Xanthobacter flavus TaxID=281 RepID=UPI003726B763